MSVALVIWRAKRKRHIILSCVACLVPPHFFYKIIPLKARLGEKIVEQNIALIFSTNFVCNISHPKKNLAAHCHKFTYIFM